MSSQKPITILVVDDHPIVRDGLRGQIATQTDLWVVAEAATAEEALVALHHHEVDVLLTDLRMPGCGGVGLITTVRRTFPATEVVVLSTYDTESDVGAALAAGARSYLLKDSHRDLLFAAIRDAHRGTATFSPAVQSRMRRLPAGPGLSDREIAVLSLVAEGKTNRQIGAELFIGEATVKTHLQHVFTKLGTSDRAAAVAVAYRSGLL